MLDELNDLTNGDKDRMNVYIATYKESITENVAILQEALKDKDLEKVKYAVHRSKPLFTMFGFKDIYALAKEIENEIQHEHLSEITLLKTEAFVLKMNRSLDDLIKFTS